VLAPLLARIKESHRRSGLGEVFSAPAPIYLFAFPNGQARLLTYG
jgi:hypothetical protein